MGWLRRAAGAWHQYVGHRPAPPWVPPSTPATLATPLRPYPLRAHWRQHAQPGRYPDNQAADKAALAAVRDRATERNLVGLADAWGLSTSRVSNANMVLCHAADLAGRVAAGEFPLYHAAIVARLRRDQPDLAGKALAALGGNQQRASHTLRHLDGIARQRRQLASIERA